MMNYFKTVKRGSSLIRLQEVPDSYPSTYLEEEDVYYILCKQDCPKNNNILMQANYINRETMDQFTAAKQGNLEWFKSNTMQTGLSKK